VPEFVEFRDVFPRTSLISRRGLVEAEGGPTAS
jgi:hypothetical protein